MFLLDTLLLPLWLLQLFAFCFGVIIGSFLNVYIYRFHTGKSLTGHSHCMSCGTPLTWYELFPLVSYVVLRGRCRSCGCRIPIRYLLVELATGFLFVGSLSLTLDLPLLLLWWFIFSVVVVIAVYDLYHFIIPDRLTIILTAAATIFWGYQMWLGKAAFAAVGWHVVAALSGSLFFWLLWYFSKGKILGFGDVKLVFPLGFLVGAPLVFSFVVMSFWIGAAVSLLMLAAQKLNRGQTPLHLTDKALTIKSAIPFAPFLIAGGLVIIFTHCNVLSFFSFG